MIISKSYNENYYQNRKKIIENFVREEDENCFEYIEEVESLVSSIKQTIKILVNEEDQVYEGINKRLELIIMSLEDNNNLIDKDIRAQINSEEDAKISFDQLSKVEENERISFLEVLSNLKKEMEIKEFKIQNMERLYVEIESLIKENIIFNNDYIFTLDQFLHFLCQNERIMIDKKNLHKEKIILQHKLNELIKENINLKSQNESLDFHQVASVLEELSRIDKTHTQTLRVLEDRYKELNKENDEIVKILEKYNKKYESLSNENTKLNQQLILTLAHNKIPSNKSYSEEKYHENYSTFYNNTSSITSTRTNQNKPVRSTHI